MHKEGVEEHYQYAWFLHFCRLYDFMATYSYIFIMYRYGIIKVITYLHCVDCIHQTMYACDCDQFICI